MIYQRAKFCAPCKRDYFQHIAQGTLSLKVTPPHYFARRAMAKMVDGNLIALLQFAISATLTPLAGAPDANWPLAASAGTALAIFVAGSTITTARTGGTPGKQLFHLQVTYRDGSPLGLGGAFMRAIAELLSVACLGLGYFISDSQGERRTLHDRISGTIVIARSGGWPWTR